MPLEFGFCLQLYGAPCCYALLFCRMLDIVVVVLYYIESTIEMVKLENYMQQKLRVHSLFIVLVYYVSCIGNEGMYYMLQKLLASLFGTYLTYYAIATITHSNADHSSSNQFK